MIFDCVDGTVGDPNVKLLQDWCWSSSSGASWWLGKHPRKRHNVSAANLCRPWRTRAESRKLRLRAKSTTPLVQHQATATKSDRLKYVLVSALQSEGQFSLADVSLSPSAIPYVALQQRPPQRRHNGNAARANNLDPRGHTNSAQDTEAQKEPRISLNLALDALTLSNARPTLDNQCRLIAVPGTTPSSSKAQVPSRSRRIVAGA